MRNLDSRCVEYGHHRLSSIRAAIREDILRFATFSPDYRPEVCFRTELSIFLKPAILCLFCYRIGHYLHVRGWKRLADSLSRVNLLVHKANIPSQSCIGPACFLGHRPGTSFHGTAGRNLTLFSLAVCCPAEDSTCRDEVPGPRLGDGVTVGGHAVVIGSITVGDNVTIAPMTWLNVDCPADTLAVSARLRSTHRPSPIPGLDQSSNAR